MSSDHHDTAEPLSEEVVRLLSACTDDTLDDAGAARLAELLAGDPAARETCRRFAALTAALRRQTRRDQAGQKEATLARAQRNAKSDSPFSLPGSRFPIARLLHPMTLALVLGLFAAGFLIYKFSTRPAGQAVAQRTPAPDQAAKIAATTDAQWSRAFGPDGDAIKPGQRLILQHGSAELVFGKQARVNFEGPADFVITDAATCRLDGGKLTAHVPESARGFKVFTPDGTVTDLGTEFGVYVKAGPEIPESNEQQEQTDIAGPQPDKEPPVTEVHVFKGKVELALAPTNLKSKILSAGQAVTISESKVQPLPAADPFKFALDKLQSRRRTVLLSDDFEAYDLTRQVKSLGPWIVQGGTRKGQGVSVEDPAQSIAAANAEVDVSVRLPAPPTLVGSRVANFGTSAQNSPDTYPVLGREIDGKLLAKNCQVRVEFDFFPRSDEPQLSLALATQLGHTAGIELWRSIDAAKQGVDAAKKIDFVAYRWYRMRVLLSVADGVVGEVRVDRSQWRGPEGWVRDLSYQPPTPKLDWSTPPRYALFGFPVVSPTTVGGVFWLDNVRIEAITEN